jgi:lipoprotein-anchoring transpeptidase ErfK/SrfK
MNNRILIAGIIMAALITALILSSMIFARRFQSPAGTGSALKAGKASMEEEELFSLAKRCGKSGDLLSAKDAYQKILEKFSNSNNAQIAQEGLENINIRILRSSIPTPDSISYEVQKGDTLAKIARKFSTTQELILQANNLKNAKVVPIGRKLKVHNEKMSMVVDKSQNILTLKSGNMTLKTYRVSTGINNSTPVGVFKVVNKIINPPWYTAGGVIPPDSPKNILGSRWLGLSAQGYGIHGTTEPGSIGKQVTSGCVRMNNSDVEELYGVVPDGAEVVIVD